MTEDFLKAINEISKKDGYNDARNEWHEKMISLMKWAHEQASLNKDNIEVYIAYEKCFDKLDEVLDGDYK